MPNLWGASPVGRDKEDRSYATQTVGGGGPRCHRWGNAEFHRTGEEVQVSAS